MTSVLCDVTLWLEHAKEVRALYEIISDPEEKEQMLNDLNKAGIRFKDLSTTQSSLEDIFVGFVSGK